MSSTRADRTQMRTFDAWREPGHVAQRWTAVGLCGSRMVAGNVAGGQDPVPEERVLQEARLLSRARFAGRTVVHRGHGHMVWQ
jgi:hypothetical protein